MWTFVGPQINVTPGDGAWLTSGSAWWEPASAPAASLGTIMGMLHLAVSNTDDDISKHKHRRRCRLNSELGSMSAEP